MKLVQGDLGGQDAVKAVNKMGQDVRTKIRDTLLNHPRLDPSQITYTTIQLNLAFSILKVMNLLLRFKIKD